MNIIFSSHRNAEHREVVEKMLKKYSSSKITNIYSKECISKINPETSYDLLISDRTQFIFPALILKNVKTAINSHPSMLPLHKGSQPIFWATLLKDPLGISIHEISEKIELDNIFFNIRLTYENEPIKLRHLEIIGDDENIQMGFFDHKLEYVFDKKFFSMIDPYSN